MRKAAGFSLMVVAVVMLIFANLFIHLSIKPVDAACIDWDGSGNCIQFDDPSPPPSVKGVCVANCDEEPPSDSSGRSSSRTDSSTTFDTSGINSVIIGMTVVGVIGGVGLAIAFGAKSMLLYREARKFKKESTVLYEEAEKFKKEIPYTSEPKNDDLTSTRGSLPKGYDATPRIFGDMPERLHHEPTLPKKRPIVVPPPPNIPITEPVKIIEIAELLSQKFGIKDTDWKEFFTKVGQCIIDNGGRLDAGEAWVQKYKEWATGEAFKGTVIYEEGDRSGIHNGRWLNSPKEYGMFMASQLIDQLLKKVPDAKTFGVLPWSPPAVLNFLVQNFGTNISTSYICLFYHIKEL